MTGADLLAWADSYCTKGAAATRAAASRPVEYARCLSRLDDLWFTWAYRQMTTANGWTQEQVNAVLRQADEFEAEGQTPRDAARNAFLGLQQAVASACRAS